MKMIEKLTLDYTNAMKNKQENRKIILNYVLAQLKNKQIEVRRELTDEEIVAVLRKEVKALNETIDFLKKAGKEQDIIQEMEKRKVLEGYLPALLDRESTIILLQKILERLKFSDPKKERRIIIQAVLQEAKGAVDLALVNDILNTMF